MAGSEIGAVYERLDMTHSKWVVDGIVEVHGIAHASLRRLDTTSEVKLLAVAALTDKTRYRRVGETQ